MLLYLLYSFCFKEILPSAMAASPVTPLMAKTLLVTLGFDAFLTFFRKSYLSNK